MESSKMIRKDMLVKSLEHFRIFIPFVNMNLGLLALLLNYASNLAVVCVDHLINF